MNKTQIFDRGYRRYEGPRTGTQGAYVTLVRHSMRHALGLGRSAGHKVFPVAVVLFAFTPAVVFIGAASLLPDETLGFLPEYGAYYGFVAAALFLFAGYVAPELLCTDRRTGMLGVYLTSPLNRTTYLVGKVSAIFGLMMLATLGPPLLFLIARTLQDQGPGGFGEWIKVLGQIVLSSIVVGTAYMAVALLASSLTERKAVASAVTLISIPLSARLTDYLVELGTISPRIRLLNLLYMPRALVFRIFEDGDGWTLADNPTSSLVLAWLVLVSGSAGVVWFRYQRMLVRR